MENTNNNAPVVRDETLTYQEYSLARHGITTLTILLIVIVVCVTTFADFYVTH